MNRVTFLEREIRRRPLRMFLALLSVSLGVASVVSVRLASRSASIVFQQLQETIGGRFDVEITAEDATRFDQSRIDFLSKADSIATVSPLLHRTTVVYSKGKRATIVAVGFSPEDLSYREQFEVTNGRMLSSPLDPTPTHALDRLPETDDSSLDDDLETEPVPPNTTELLFESSFARMLDVVPGDPVSLLMPRGPLRARVAGIVNLKGGAATAAEGAVFLKLADLQQAAKANQQIDAAQVRFKKGASPDAASTRIEQQLTKGLTIRKPLARTELATETLRGVEYALSFAQALALVMAVFITLNTYMISIGERRSQWGILLAIGMTRREILRMLLGEAMFVGLVGSVFGLMMGVAGASFLAQAIGSLMTTPTTQLPFDPVALGMAFVLGPALTVLACYLPARTATKIPAVEAMRGEEPRSIETFPLTAVLMATGIWTIAIVCIFLAVTGRIPTIASIPAGILMMLGFVLMVPPTLEPLAGTMSRFCLEWLWPAEGEIARRQVFLKPRRAALTTAVMIVALADGIGLGHAIVNTLRDVRDWYQRTLAADVVLLPTDPAQSAAFGLKASSPMEKRIEAIEGVEGVKAIRLASVRVNDLPAVVIARDFPQNEPMPWSMTEAETNRLRQQLANNQVVVGSVLASRAGLSIGNTIRVEHTGKSATLQVAAIVTDYHAGGLSLYLQRETCLSALGIDGVDMFLLKLSKKNRQGTEQRLETLCASSNLTKRSFDELQKFLDAMMAKVVAAFWGVLAIGLIVAGFGTFNTLSMNVLEQTREIGLMRVIGMTSSQVHRTVLCQALILGFLGAVLGTVAGLTTAYVMHLCMGKLLLRNTSFEWQPTIIIGCNAMALLLLIPAALLPAWRATRMNIWGALQYE